MSHTRRTFLTSVAATTLAAAVPTCATTRSATTNPALSAAPPQNPLAGKKPNVLFIMSDDMRVELGCYNSMFHAKTPHIDALANAGVRFDRNYCQFPICNPSRASMMTGHRPTVTTVLGNRTDFRTAHPDWIALPQLFKNNGYTSIRSGKIFHGGLDDVKSWSIGGGIPDGPGGAGGHTLVIPRPDVSGQSQKLPARFPQDHAAESDRIVVLDHNGEGHPDYKTADHAIAYLNQFKDQPFFLGCGFVKPHSPPCAPQNFLDLYNLDDIHLTPDFAPIPTVPPGFPSAAIRKRNADLFIGRTASVDEAKQVIRAYIASISWCDWNVGRVLAELDRLGLRQNTIVVFAVDHGYQLGEKGKWSKAGSLFEMGTRTPFIIHAPGFAGNGQPCTRIVESLDVYRTLAQLCELPLPTPDIEGTSLLPLLHNPAAQWNKPAYSVWSEDGATLHGVAVRTEKFRYAEYGPNGIGGAMLFDSHADPLEMKNLAADPAYAQTCAELSALTRQYAAGHA